MNCNTRMRLGIPARETPDEIGAQPNSVDVMRRRIEEASHESAMIANVLRAARFNGMSGEDTYVTLAYQALRLLEDAYQREQHYLRKFPSPLSLIKPEGETGG